MNVELSKTRVNRSFILAVCAVIGASCLVGCSGGGSSFSKSEMQQFKDGPPKEMPPQARAMFEQAGKKPPNAGPPGQAAPPK